MTLPSGRDVIYHALRDNAFQLKSDICQGESRPPGGSLRECWLTNWCRRAIMDGSLVRVPVISGRLCHATIHQDSSCLSSHARRLVFLESRADSLAVPLVPRAGAVLRG